MEEVLTNPSVIRVTALLRELSCPGEVTILSDSARTALDAAMALGIEAGQVASSIVFKLPSGNPLLIITSGRHRVDTELVAKNLGVEKLHRADADFVKNASGFSIGGVSPLGWISKPEIILIDEALNDYEVVWAAAGHPHAVYPTSYAELIECTG
ncbi:MAG: YbaK/EbsC family protein, partial [Actinobacteria bacterium]|nr:YbaK/EbsC family protein [Actinomycetota bacterium]